MDLLVFLKKKIIEKAQHKTEDISLIMYALKKSRSKNTFIFLIFFETYMVEPLAWKMEMIL